VLTQATFAFAMQHYSVFEAQAECIRVERETLYKALDALPGVMPYPSRANFILFRLASPAAEDVHAQLKARNILLKHIAPAHPLLAQCLRVTIGSPEENRQFLAALEQCLR
jgi:histidinol-phosphate aminotransferase